MQQWQKHMRVALRLAFLYTNTRERKDLSAMAFTLLYTTPEMEYRGCSIFVLTPRWFGITIRAQPSGYVFHALRSYPFRPDFGLGPGVALLRVTSSKARRH